MTKSVFPDVVARHFRTDSRRAPAVFRLVDAAKAGLVLEHEPDVLLWILYGSVNLSKYTSSSKLILDAMVDLYERITQPDLLVRRVTVTANHVIREKDVPKPEDKGEQLDLFTDYTAITAERERAETEERKEKSLQHAMIAIKHKFGKNAILKGPNLQVGGMTIERNQQIGGHKA